MDDKDVQGFLEWITNFIATVGNGIAAALEMLPPVVLGIIVIVLGIVFLWHKAKD